MQRHRAADHALPQDPRARHGLLFVTVRKGENIANEVAVMLGFPAKPATSQAGAAAKPNAAATDPAIHLGATRYGLVIKDSNAWLQNQAEETRVVTEMTRTAKLQVKTTSMRGNRRPATSSRPVRLRRGNEARPRGVQVAAPARRKLRDRPRTRERRAPGGARRWP